MSQVLKVLEMIKIYIFQTFEFFWTSNFNSTRAKQPTEHGGNVDNNKFHLKITYNLFSIVNFIIRCY